MSKLEEIKKRLETRKISVIAQIAGIHPNTLYGIAAGTVKNPSLLTIEKIEAALNESV